MATKFCTNCGAKLRDNAKFCGSCGKKVSDTPETSEKLSETNSETPAKIQNSSPKTLEEIYAEEESKSQNKPLSRDFSNLYQGDSTIQEMFLTTNGRLNRMRYFKRWLVLDIVTIILSVVISELFSTGSGDNLTSTGEIILNVMFVSMLIPRFCLDVRRIKDIGQSETVVYGVAGLEFVLTLIYIYVMTDFDFTSFPDSVLPLSAVSFGIFIWIQSTAGTVGDNKYGEDPLEGQRFN